MAGAMSSALCSMVGNLTKGKKKYAQYEEDVLRMVSEAQALRLKLMMLIDEDANGFKPLQEAYSIPKSHPGREQVLIEASISAGQAPLEMMTCICQVIDLLDVMRIKGNQLLVSDVGCGALLARAALESAAMNIFVNTKSIKSADAKAIEEQTESLLDEYLPKAEETAALVLEKLRK